VGWSLATLIFPVPFRFRGWLGLYLAGGSNDMGMGYTSLDGRGVTAYAVYVKVTGNKG